MLLQGNTAGNLILGTTTSGNISFLTSGGAPAANLSARSGLEIYANSASVSTTTGAVIVAGGIGALGNINAGGNLTAQGDFTTLGNATIAGKLVLQNNLPSVNTTTGELVISGGMGIGGNINAGGNLSTSGNAGVSGNLVVSGNLSSVSTQTGTIVVTGGVGVSGNINAGGNLSARGNFTTLGNAVINGNVTVKQNTPSNGINTGALVVSGGAGINGNVNVAGNVAVVNATSAFYGNIYADKITSMDGSITLTPASTGVTVISSNTALQVPVGSVQNRPTNPSNGYLRYNTDSVSMEYYDGAEWITVKSTIRDQTIIGDGVTQTYDLLQEATAVGILVTINGTAQRPDDAYTVHGTKIDFAEPPLTTDIVDIRYLAATVSVNVNASENFVFGSSIAVGTNPVLIDNFLASEIRSAKYVISNTTDSDAQIFEIQVVQFNGVVSLNTIGSTNTGNNSLIFSANISGNSVNLWAEGTSTINQVLVQRTYFSS